MATKRKSTETKEQVTAPDTTATAEAAAPSNIANPEKLAELLNKRDFTSPTSDEDRKQKARDRQDKKSDDDRKLIPLKDRCGYFIDRTTVISDGEGAPVMGKLRITLNDKPGGNIQIGFGVDMTTIHPITKKKSIRTEWMNMKLIDSRDYEKIMEQTHSQEALALLTFIIMSDGTKVIN